MTRPVAQPTEPRSPGIDLRLELDASEPFLADHRPGGQPLFGTAMGVDLMHRAARDLLELPPSASVCLEHVHVFGPLVLSGPAGTVDVRAGLAGWPGTGDTGDNSDRRAHCVVESRRWGQPPVPHFDAVVRVGAGSPSLPRLPVGFDLASMRGAAPAVNAEAVYALFFHGPAFRVVRGASSTGDGMLCEWQADLPPLTRAARAAPGDSHAEAPWPDPRWLELCLQAAGLLEIATTRRMLIPHRIDRIEHLPVPVPVAVRVPEHAPERCGPRRLFAFAQRACRGAAEGAIDIDLVDEHHTLLLRVSGYHTVPLPFPPDTQAVAALARAFGTR